MYAGLGPRDEAVAGAGSRFSELGHRRAELFAECFFRAGRRRGLLGVDGAELAVDRVDTLLGADGRPAIPIGRFGPLDGELERVWHFFVTR